jgi:uncharacterized protein YydD (DUF2326 family)
MNDLKEVLRALREERYATAEVMLTKILDKEWVEVTVDEIRKLANDNLSRVDPGEVDFAFALELLIREKNE